MSEKNDFHGEVGQAVIGDVNEGTRLSNVVNLHLNEPKKEAQRITEYQRKRINMLVKEWAAICGDEEIEIYKIFIADFGIRYFRELPIEHYMTVKKTLEEWIAAGVAKSSIAPAAPAQETTPVSTATIQAPVECAACKEKDALFSRSQRTIFALAILVLVLTASCAWLLYQMPAPGDSTAADGHCIYEGKPYSAGSTIKAAGGVLRECIAAPDGRSVAWARPK